MKRGKLVILCGPSGVGKNAIENKLNLKRFNFIYSISTTTRLIREGEIPNKNYHFVTKKQFKAKIRKGAFLEWAIFSGNYYGTPIENVEQMLSMGRNVFMQIEILGTKQILKYYPEAITIFIAPPSFEILKQRLLDRGTEKINTVNKRLKQAKKELKNKHLFKYVVINNDLEKTVKEVEKILEKEIYEN